MQFTKSGNWPVPLPPPDPYFEYTTLLLPGNGTNGAQNNTFLDSSGSSVSITRNGSSTQGTFSPFSVGAGYWSNYFNNTTGLSIPTGSGTPTFWNSDFTIEYWVNCSSSKSINTVLSSWFDGSFGGGSWWLPIIDGAVQLFHNQSSSSNQGPFITSGSTLVNDNRWHHVAITQVTGGNKTFRIFIDGVLRGYTTQTNWTQASANATIYVGAPGPGTYDETGRYMLGSLSNIRLTTSVVAAYSTSATTLGTTVFTPPTSPLTAISGTNILTCQSNRFVDNSSNAFTITVNGTPSVQAFSPFNPTDLYSAATNGGSGYFAGYGNYLTFSNSIWTALAGVNTTFTVEAWVYRTAADSQSSDICGTNVSGYTQSVTFNISTSGALQFSDWGGGSSYTATATASGSVPLNAWTHVAASKSGSTMRLFVNGVLLATNTIVNASISTLDGSPANVAGRPAGATMFIGYMSSLRIVPGTAVYTANFTPPTGPLTAISGTSLLLNFTNAGIIDATAKNDLQTVGNAQISTAQSKFGGGSMAFDGSVDYLTRPNSNLFQLASGPFTIEFWYRTNTLSPSNFGFACIVGMQQVSGAGGWGVWQLNQAILFFIDGGASSYATGNVLTSTGVWYHVAVTRDSSNNMKTFIDGVQQGSQASVSFSNNATQPLTVGGINTSTGWNENYYVNGYIDDLRITKGIARYTSNFTPPTSAFPLL
jgi:hypothetical protein